MDHEERQAAERLASAAPQGQTLLVRQADVRKVLDGLALRDRRLEQMTRELARTKTQLLRPLTTDN